MVTKLARRTLIGGAIAGAAVGGFAWGRSTDPSISVFGDSTAIGDRIPYPEKPLNLVPMLDPTRWWNQIGRRVANHGVGGWRLDQTLELIEGGVALTHRIVLFDRINTEEAPDAYLATMARIVARLSGRAMLILPQIANAPPGAETGAMAAVNAELRSRWSQYCLSPVEARGLHAALADPATRADALHRNPAGQAIEARFIRAWMDRHGW